MPPTPPLLPSSCVLSPFELALFLTPFFLSFFLFSQKKEHVTAILLSWKGKNFFRGDNDFSAFQGGWIRALKWAIHTLAFYHEKVSRWRGGGWIMKILCRDYEGLKEFREGGEGVYTRWKNIERARNALGDGDFLWTWLKSMVKPLRCLHLIKRGKC